MEMGLTDKQVVGVARKFRYLKRNRKTFEPDLRKKLTELNHSLDSLFSLKMFEFEKKEKNNEITKILGCFVYCNNVDELIGRVKESRNLHGPVNLKIGVDSGGGFLKIILSIQSLDEDTEQKNVRQKYDDEIASKKFKDSGVNKMFLIGIFQFQ